MRIRHALLAACIFIVAVIAAFVVNVLLAFWPFGLMFGYAFGVAAASCVIGYYIGLVHAFTTANLIDRARGVSRMTLIVTVVTAAGAVVFQVLRMFRSLPVNGPATAIINSAVLLAVPVLIVLTLGHLRSTNGATMSGNE